MTAYYRYFLQLKIVRSFVKNRNKKMCPVPAPHVSQEKMERIDEEEKHDSSLVSKMKIRATSDTDSSSTVISGSELSNHEEMIVERIGRALEAVAKLGDDKSKLTQNDVYVNGSGKVPSISIRSYLRRMLKYIDGGSGSTSWTSLSAGARALIFAIIYIDRLVIKTGLVVNSLKIHRLIAAGVLVALKMHEDAVVDMGFFSSLAGIPFKEMKTLEHKTLELLKWDLVVSEADFKIRVTNFQRLTGKKSH